MALQQLDDLARREHLETLHRVREIGSGSDEMQVIFEHNIAVQRETLLFSQESPAIEYDLNGIRPRENGEPADDSTSHEVRILGLEDAVASTGHGEGYSTKRSFEEERSQTGVWERGGGNERRPR